MKSMIALSLLFAAQNVFAMGSTDLSRIKAELSAIESQYVGCQEELIEGAGEERRQTALMCGSDEADLKKVAVITYVVENPMSKCADKTAISIELVK